MMLIGLTRPDRLVPADSAVSGSVQIKLIGDMEPASTATNGGIYSFKILPDFTSGRQLRS